MKKNHVIKCDLAPFADVWSGVKRAEVRVNDRDYAVGDALTMTEFNGDVTARVGRFIRAEITHVQTGYGLPDNLAVLSFDVISRHHSGGEPETAPNEEVQDALDVLNSILRFNNRALLFGPRDQLHIVDFGERKFEPGYDFGVLHDQAAAWQEVANCIHEIDPDWHQNGRPTDSAVKFIKKLYDARAKPEDFIPSDYYSVGQQRVGAALAALLLEKDAPRNEWHYFEVRVMLNGSVGSANYSTSDMVLESEKGRDIYSTFARRTTRLAAFGAMYGRPALTFTRTEKGFTIEHGLPATDYQPLPTGTQIAASLGINPLPVQNKAPGEHPADRIDRIDRIDNGEL